MRIGIYLRTLASARGAEQAASALARGLVARGHQVDVLLEKAGGWLAEDLAARGVRVIDLAQAPTGRVASLLARARSAAGALLEAPGGLVARDGWLMAFLRILWDDDPPLATLVRYVDVDRPDGVISFLSYPSIVLARVARRCRGRARFLASVHNHVSSGARDGSNWLRTTPVLMRRFFGDLDAVVAVSRGVAADVLAITGLPADRIHTIYNPVYEPEIDARAAEPPAHPWLVDRSVPVVLGVGKLKPQKDFGLLLRAFARVLRERPARLVILGEGELREQLQREVRERGLEDRVDLAGVVRNPYPFYAHASVLALSSRWEGFGNVLVEALACGCPVVSTDCPSGPAEILGGGTFGRLVPPGDAEALAGAILETLEAPPPREKLVARAREFSVERSVRAYEALVAGGAEEQDAWMPRSSR